MLIAASNSLKNVKVEKTPEEKESKIEIQKTPDTINLDDFKIKKVIDKGSFGKVFLVVNTKTGKEHAMKRINKDILIEKG